MKDYINILPDALQVFNGMEHMNLLILVLAIFVWRLPDFSTKTIKELKLIFWFLAFIALLYVTGEFYMNRMIKASIKHYFKGVKNTPLSKNKDLVG